MGQVSLVGAVEDVLLQGRVLLTTVDEQVYRWKDVKACGASIGMHYRHVLEHFQCLLEGMDNGRIDYDGRRRSSELETSVGAAVQATDQLIARYRALPDDYLQSQCRVQYSVGPEDEGAEAGTTLAREVMFCVGHATHHYALMKPLCAQLGVPLPYEFGVAPSTLKHMQTQETR
jgi:uncharacterized damage-inducible protein DinB